MVQGQFPHEENVNAAAAHCPRCGTEYRRGFTVCADDGTDLRRGPAPERGPWNQEPSPEPSGSDDWPRGEEPVVVARLLLHDAHLLAGRLRTDGIPAQVDPVRRGVVAMSHGPGLHDVLVPRSRAEDARSVIGTIR